MKVTQNKNHRLAGLLVAVKTENKNSKVNHYQEFDYQQDLKIVKIKEHYTMWFLDFEGKTYSISDIVMIF